MDQSRAADIKRLNLVLNDPKKSRATKRWADKTKKIIVRQLRDRKLRHLREQLISAARHHDLKTEMKLANAIKDYLKQEKLEI